jgi:hypothetical protein
MSVSFTYDDAAETWTINRHGVVIVLDLSAVPGNGFNANRREKIRQAAQEKLFDNRILLTDLPIDDPDRTVDTAPKHGEKMRWEVYNSQTYLVSREYILEALDWDGTKLIPTIRKARGV